MLHRSMSPALTGVTTGSCIGDRLHACHGLQPIRRAMRRIALHRRAR
jgi:hypothetical protein